MQISRIKIFLTRDLQNSPKPLACGTSRGGSSHLRARLRKPYDSKALNVRFSVDAKRFPRFEHPNIGLSGKKAVTAQNATLQREDDAINYKLVHLDYYSAMLDDQSMLKGK